MAIAPIPFAWRKENPRRWHSDLTGEWGPATMALPKRVGNPALTEREHYKMAQPSIHDVSATAFEALTPSKATDFLASVLVAWLPSGKVSVETEIALPESYEPMVTRRIKQLAKRTNQDTSAVEAKVIERAVELRDELVAAGEAVAV